MNTKTRLALVIALTLFGVALLVGVPMAVPALAPQAPGGAPTVVSYQGEILVGGTPYNGSGYFKFAVVNAAGDTSYWSNDGTSSAGSEPTAYVQLVISDGLFSLLLGDTTLGGMTQALSASVFSQPDRYLRVWFSTSSGSTYSQLTPDTRIAAVPYALQAQEAVDADMVDGLHASELVVNYQNVVAVAKSGGDFTSVQAAIDSITGASEEEPYLVWVAPGVYSETVTMKPFVHLQGAGQEATVISSTVSTSAWPPDTATLTLASDTSLRDLTISNSGAGDSNTALLATAGITRALVADVAARALGSGMSNYTIVLSGVVRLHRVSALAENGYATNAGLVDLNGAAAVLRGGDFTGRGGGYGGGIFTTGSGTTLEAIDISVLGEDGSSNNYGLYNTSGVTATLHGGDFIGRGGTEAYGIYNRVGMLEADGVTALGENGSSSRGAIFYKSAVRLRGGSFTGRGGGMTNGIYNTDSSAMLEAVSVTALAEGGDSNYGLENRNDAEAMLRGGSFTGRGGDDAYGIYNAINDAMLEAVSVTALGEDGSSNNYGLYNYSGAIAMLSGGSFTGRGGEDTYGVYNTYDNPKLEAVNVTALGEDGSSNNYGLYNYYLAKATLRGGSFTGRGGDYTCGIHSDSYAKLEADGVTALGENGNNSNYGLSNTSSGVEATLHGGSFTGRGGTKGRGISNHDNAILEAENVTILGENGSSANSGLVNSDDAFAKLTQSVLEGYSYSVHSSSSYTITVSNSRLIGSVGGGVTCVGVSQGTIFYTSSCPP
jgi:hypothetical protein